MLHVWTPGCCTCGPQDATCVDLRMLHVWTSDAACVDLRMLLHVWTQMLHVWTSEAACVDLRIQSPGRTPCWVVTEILSREKWKRKKSGPGVLENYAYHLVPLPSEDQ